MAKGKEWVVLWEKDVEGPQTVAIGNLKKAIKTGQERAERYGFAESQMMKQARELVNASMVCVSEALLLQSMRNVGPKTPSEVAAQLARMMAMKVPAIASPILEDCLLVCVDLSKFLIEPEHIHII